MESELLPCRKCGSTDFDLWDGLGTQADMYCNECGESEGVQVIDLIDREMRYAVGNEFNMETLKYPQSFIDIANKHMAEEWNKRYTRAPQTVTSEEVKEAVEEAQYCVDHITRLQKIPDEDNAIWSTGTSSRPRITAKTLKTLIQAATQSGTQKEVSEMPDVVKFLLGEGPLAGVWFGEQPEGFTPYPYWWRKYLRLEYIITKRGG